MGVSRDELVFWVDDESSEGASYERMLARVSEPWIQLVLRPLAHDEGTNAQLLRDVLQATA